MREFLQKAFLSALLVILVLISFCGVVLAFVAPQYSFGYDASILDKIERLESINKPKIILVGNSNLSFGIESSMLEESMGMPVVNLGLHGSLGNTFHENMAKFNINCGDIVVVSHSTFDERYSGIADYSLAWITIENHFKLWKIIPLNNWPEMIVAFPEYAYKAIKLKVSGNGNQTPKGVYSRASFNEYGDIALERPECIHDWTAESIRLPIEAGKNAIASINRLNDYCREKGAVLLIAACPIADGEFTPDHSRYRQVWDDVKASVNCPVISDIDDYFFEYSMFYDGEPHLTTEATRIRTSQLIEDLTTWKSSVESN